MLDFTCHEPKTSLHYPRQQHITIEGLRGFCFFCFRAFTEMSSKGKRKEEDEEYASDGSGDTHARPKKAPKGDFSDASDDIVVCEISKNRRVSVRYWQGKVWIDIREFYLKDGKQCPGKKGISLSVDQWNVLRDHIEEINRALDKCS